MTPATLYAALDATWPAAACSRVGPWLIREGQGGGQRVSAATVEGRWTPADIPMAEAAMARLGQPALFMIRKGDGPLDDALQAMGYRRHDPVVAYAAPCASLAEPEPEPMAAFPHWPPLAIVCDLWAEAGIGPGRIAVMQRAKGPKAAILARQNDRATGAAFVAVHGDTAMLHALEIAPQMRRRGAAGNLLRRAAGWAQEHGARTLAVVVTEANAAARALYASLEMEVVGQYHYRLK